MIECPACRKEFTPPQAVGLPYTCPNCLSKIVGAYCDLELIGNGSMGQVYRARRPDMRDQRVAIKIPKTSNDDSRERFNREIAASATLRHENIVRAFDCGEVDGHLFLAMNLEEGRILKDIVSSEGPLPCHMVGQIVRDVAMGLVHAKSWSIVNRDIKPDNILITSTGVTKLLDFGLAKIAGADQSIEHTTAAGTLLGTIAFMAPEQARDPRDVQIAADVYSLGCTAYYALAGCPPFSGKRDDIVNQHATFPRPDLAAVRSDTPAVLSALVQRMMAIAASDRPTPETIVAEVSSYLTHLPKQLLEEHKARVTVGQAIEEGLPIEPGPDEPQEGELLDDLPLPSDTKVDFDTPMANTAISAQPNTDSGMPTLPIEGTIADGEVIEDGVAAVSSNTGSTAPFMPHAWPPNSPPAGQPETLPVLPMEGKIEEGEPVPDTLPLDSLVGTETVAPSPLDSPAPMPAATSTTNTKSHTTKGKIKKPQNKKANKQKRNLIAVTLVVVMGMLCVIGARNVVLAPPDPQAVWDNIQEEYQLHKWTFVESELATFEQDHPDDPHVKEIPFFLAMCDAGRDIFSQTGDAKLALEKLETIYQEFRDTQEYDKYCSDLFLDLQRVIERFVERIEKTSEPEALASAQQARELLGTVAESMSEEWVQRELDKLDGSIHQMETQLEVALAKDSLLNMLKSVAEVAASDDAHDKAYEDAKELLKSHVALQDDKDIEAAFEAAYKSEASRVVYEPVSDTATASSADADDPSDEKIFVVWDEPSVREPQDTSGVFLALADGVLYAFDQLGTHLWSHHLGLDSHSLPISLKPSSTSPEAVIAVSAVENVLVAISSRNGRVLWRYAPDDDQILGASLTLSRWKPAANKPARVRGLIPTANGDIHVIELVRGNELGKFRTGVPMTVGGSFDPVTQLLYMPADSKRIFAIDPAVIEAEDAQANPVRSVLFTNHLSGSLSARPLIVGQYLLLTELFDLDNTQIRAFELQNPIGFSTPDAAPVKMRTLPGWSWFTPPLTPDRMTVVTDAGELGVFGLNLDNPDEALYPLIQDSKGRCPTLAIDAPYRAMAIHSDEHLLWVMAGGTLRQIGLDILSQKISTLWPENESAAQVVGMPLHQATFDRESERLYIATRTLDATRANFTSVDANTGNRIWSRQLGIHAVGDPIVSGDNAMLVDRSGRILQMSLSESGESHASPRVIADDPELTAETGGELVRIHALDGTEYLTLPISDGNVVAYRRIDPAAPFQPTWQTLALPATRIQGRPAIVDGYMLVPCSNGSLQRIALNESTPTLLNEQTYQWTSERTVVPDDAPAVYGLGPRSIVLVLRDTLRWLDYVYRDGVGFWKQQRLVLLDSPASGEVAISDKYLFVAAENRSLYRIQRDGIGEPEPLQLDGRWTAGPFLANGHVLAVVDGQKLVAFNQTEDQAAWTIGPLGGRLCGRPFHAGRSIMVTDDSGTVSVIRLASGKITRELQLPHGAIPAAASVPFGRGRILTPLADGTLAWHNYLATKTTPSAEGKAQ